MCWKKLLSEQHPKVKSVFLDEVGFFLWEDLLRLLNCSIAPSFQQTYLWVTLACLFRDLIPKDLVTEWFKGVLDAVTHCIIFTRIVSYGRETTFTQESAGPWCMTRCLWKFSPFRRDQLNELSSLAIKTLIKHRPSKLKTSLPPDLFIL